MYSVVELTCVFVCFVAIFFWYWYRHPVKVVPILVGALNADNEAIYGRLLAKYVDDPTNFFSISSDFCHWGSRYVPIAGLLQVQYTLVYYIAIFFLRDIFFYLYSMSWIGMKCLLSFITTLRHIQPIEAYN